MQISALYPRKTSPRRLILALVVAVVLAVPFSALAEDGESIKTLRQMGKAFGEIAKQALPAVVGIKAERTVTYRAPSIEDWPFGQPFDPFEDDLWDWFFRRRAPQRYSPRRKSVQTAQGSGFIISPDGYILTNNHVVQGADKVTVSLLDGEPIEAKIVGTDPDSEVAVIKIDRTDLPYLQIADSDTLEVGEWVLAIGNPFGFSHTVTAGIVSATGRSNVGLTTFENYIQTDAAINPGNSGGPLINLDGKVVGINTAIVSRTGGNIGIGLAIPINMAKFVFDQLVESGQVVRGFLGVRIQDLDPELAESFGLDKDTHGVLIPEVTPDSAADKAGLKQGDIIVEFQDKPVEKASDLLNRVASLKPGTKVKIVVVRNGERETLYATLGQRKPSVVASDQPSDQLDKLGITVDNLTGELAQRFGYEDVQGVIVTRVESGSEAAKKGITPGTLIMEVNREPVKNVREFNEAMQQAAEQGSALLLVRQEQYIRYVVLRFD